MTIFSRLAPLALLAALASPAGAECYADYKAKQDNPLRLHYGVIELSDAACQDRDRARAEAETRIARDGWRLLSLMSTFGSDGLSQRRESAGAYYLRY